MLVRFITKNFLSFKEETEFNMLTGRFKIHKDHIYETSNGIEVLKVASIYGANGSGKSNLVKALEYLQDLVLHGEIHTSNKPRKFKLDPSLKDQPTTFEVEFIIDDKLYSYGLAIQKGVIHEEWLFEVEPATSDIMIFERKLINEKISINLHSKYLESQKEELLLDVYQDEILKKNELFLSKVYEKYEDLENAHDWFEHYLRIIHPRAKPQYLAAKFTVSSDFRKFTNDLLSNFDTGVHSLGIKTIPVDIFFGEDDRELKEQMIEEFEEAESSTGEGHAIVVKSAKEDLYITKEEDGMMVNKIVADHTCTDGSLVSFDLEDESDGTRRLLDLIPAIEMINEIPGTIFIDEIDQSIHPALLKNFLKKLLKNDKMKGQILFTTHESNLLDLNLFRQDEIWFTEKDSYGATNIYSLSDYKPRYDLDIRKGYLKGRFGALPFLGNLKDLNWSDYASEEQSL